MGIEFLVRVRRVTLALTVPAALAGAVYGGIPFGLAIALGALWSVGNILFLEALARLLVAGRLGRAPATRDVAAVLGGVPVLLGGGWAVLASGLPLLAAALGFWILFAVVVLKGLGLALARALDFATGRSAERPCDAVRRPLPSRRAQGLMGWALVATVAGGLVLWALAAPKPGAPAPGGAPVAAIGSGAASAPAAVHEPAVTGEPEGGGEPAGGHPEGVPTIPGVLAKLLPHAAWAHGWLVWENLFYALLAGAFLMVGVRWAFARPKLVPDRAQAAVELVAQGAYDFLTGTFGPEMARYVPFVGSLFFYILTMNWMGMIPFFKAPTSSLNTTAAMAVVVFLYVQYTAIRYQGLFGYLHHMAGSPRDAIGWAVAPVLLPIELMGELIKPISLAARLFGNIFGEDLLVAVFVGIGAAVMAWQPAPVGFPIHVLFMFLGLIMSAVQALVFALLTAVYLYMALPHGHDEELHGAADGAQPAHA
jgi:F-type H+-transporting ATPase subunit a